MNLPATSLTRLMQRLPSLVTLRLVRFGVVGLSGVIVNLALIRIFLGELRFPTILASALACEVSIGNNFVWNNWWTFGQRVLSVGRFARFNLASLGGLAITTLIFSFLVQRFGMNYLLADLIAIGVATGWNFAASIFWTWAN